VFDGATAQAAWTKPSVASLMTGVYVHKHGVVSNRDALGGAQPTLAEVACARYQTAAFSANPGSRPVRFDRK
jgi:arylsulfatase A-like enzyme